MSDLESLIPALVMLPMAGFLLTAVIALMVIAVAAAEATVGLAIVIAIFRNAKTPLVDEYDHMRR